MAGVLAVVCAVQGGALFAQDAAKSTSEPKPMEEAKERKGPLPINYGKLGLSDEQKEKAYVVLDEYKAQIETLQQQVKKLLAERETKLQALLTEGQKTRLKELNDAAKAKAAVKTAPPVTTPAVKKTE
jgi:hypothetical protein